MSKNYPKFNSKCLKLGSNFWEIRFNVFEVTPLQFSKFNVRWLIDSISPFIISDNPLSLILIQSLINFFIKISNIILT